MDSADEPQADLALSLRVGGFLLTISGSTESDGYEQAVEFGSAIFAALAGLKTEKKDSRR